MTTSLFTNARLIDPEVGSDAPGWLLIEGDTIKATGSGEAPKADSGTRKAIAPPGWPRRRGA
jgi:predicted amidohydrolase